MKSYEFGKTSDGRIVNAYVIENINGIRVEFLDLGCILRQFWVMKSDDSYVNIVHGLDSVKDYENDSCCFGAFIGRFANRIKDGRFSLGGQEYDLIKNDGPNYLHGSWRKRVFEAHPLPGKTLEEVERGVVFTYRSPDGEDGFPGNVDVKVTYMLDDDNVLHMDFEAVPDKDTVMNLTNHSYFCLGADQMLSVNSDRYLEVDSAAIPSGKFISVDDDPVMDFRKFKKIDDESPAQGYYDHCYVLDHASNPLNAPDVVINAPGRGITLEISTSEPGVQIYSGVSVGIAVEPQGYPCAPNFSHFPSALVKAGEKRKWKNTYKIIVDY